MKKYIISSALMVAAIASVSAEQSASVTLTKATPVQGKAMVGMQVQMAQPVTITTGDAAVDAKIKALQQEMEIKIKAIRDDYMAKIKVVIGDKKVITGGMMLTASGTAMRMDGQGNMGWTTSTSSRPQGRMMASGTPPQGDHGRMMMGSGTPPQGDRQGMNMRGEGGVPTNARVEGEATEGGIDQGVSASAAASVNVSGIRGFFMHLFGK